jgi:hypothetical protein
MPLVGCIDRDTFDRYYAGTSTGAGITIRKAVRLDSPALIADLLPSGVPPQSFAYVDQSHLSVSRTANRDFLVAKPICRAADGVHLEKQM